MNFDEPRIMIDIETTGIRPGCKILAIGAVKFYLTETTPQFFSEIIRKDDNRFHEEAGTMKFWDKQDASIRRTNFCGIKSYEEVLTSLIVWIGNDYDKEIWCKGSAFDIPILEHAFDKIGYEIPWKYYNVMCLRTMLKQHPRIEMPVRTTAEHIAINDAVYQAECAVKLLRALH